MASRTVTTEPPRESVGGELTVALPAAWWRRAVYIAPGLLALVIGVTAIADWYLSERVPTSTLTDPLVLGVLLIPLGLFLAGRGRHLGVTIEPTGIIHHHFLRSHRLKWADVRRVWVARDDLADYDVGVLGLFVWRWTHASRPDRRLSQRRALLLAVTLEEEARARGIPLELGAVPAAIPPEWRLPLWHAPVRRDKQGRLVLRRPVALSVLAGTIEAAVLGALVAGGGIALSVATSTIVRAAAAAALVGVLDGVRRGLRAGVWLDDDEVRIRNLFSKATVATTNVRWVGPTRRHRWAGLRPALLGIGRGERSAVRAMVGFPGRRRANAAVWCAARDWARHRGLPTQAAGVVPSAHPWSLDADR